MSFQTGFPVFQNLLPNHEVHSNMQHQIIIMMNVSIHTILNSIVSNNGLHKKYIALPITVVDTTTIPLYTATISFNSIISA